mgnify:CR=1 FL=1
MLSLAALLIVFDERAVYTINECKKECGHDNSRIHTYEYKRTNGTYVNCTSIFVLTCTYAILIIF